MDFKIHMLSNVMQLHRSCYAEDISEAKNMQGCLFVCFKKKCSSLRAIGNCCSKTRKYLEASEFSLKIHILKVELEL